MTIFEKFAVITFFMTSAAGLIALRKRTREWFPEYFRFAAVIFLSGVILGLLSLKVGSWIADFMMVISSLLFVVAGSWFFALLKAARVEAPLVATSKD